MTSPSQAVVFPRQTRTREFRPRPITGLRRVTLPELMVITGASKPTLDWWGTLGAFGEGWSSRRSRWKTMTCETAERAVLMRRLLESGATAAEAASLVNAHEYGDRRDLTFIGKDGPVTVRRADLDIG